MTKILVAGATGTQGGAVIDHLLSGEYDAYEVYGLTRDAEGERARGLADRGVTVVEGDLTDRERMRALLDGMDAAFLVTTFFEDGPAIETEQGVAFAEAAAEAGIDHLVYSSVGGADADTGLPHFESKYAVEQRIAELGIPATVVRPVYFMQNFAFMHGEQLADGELAMPLAEGVTLQVVDARDIGMAVATALADPERFVGETVELAGDERTLEGFAAAFTEVLDRDVTPVHLDLADYRAAAGDEMADMFQWFNDVGYDVDIDGLGREYGIETRTLPAFLADADAFTRAPSASR